VNTKVLVASALATLLGLSAASFAQTPGAMPRSSGASGTSDPSGTGSSSFGASGSASSGSPSGSSIGLGSATSGTASTGASRCNALAGTEKNRCLREEGGAASGAERAAWIARARAAPAWDRAPDRAARQVLRRAELLKSGGVEGDRTLDLRIANATLSQLSYHPEKGADFTAGGGARTNDPAARSCAAIRCCVT
jgi:hypothetical protein